MKYAYPQKYLYINNKRSSHGLINITFVRYYERDIFSVDKKDETPFQRLISISFLCRNIAVMCGDMPHRSQAA